MVATRAASILIYQDKVLVCHAPNRRHGENTWDLPKGHRNAGETYKHCALRELFEETGLSLKDIQFSNSLLTKRYDYGEDKIKFLVLPLESSPERRLICTSYFDWKGKQLPEVDEFKWCPVEELKYSLYPKLSKIVPGILEENKELWKKD